VGTDIKNVNRKERKDRRELKRKEKEAALAAKIRSSYDDSPPAERQESQAWGKFAESNLSPTITMTEPELIMRRIAM
jgi:hypothetical protein